MCCRRVALEVRVVKGLERGIVALERGGRKGSCSHKFIYTEMR